VFTTGIGTPIDPANLLDDFKRILEGRTAKHSLSRFKPQHRKPSARVERSPPSRDGALGHSQISLTMTAT
jgi:hypothetical protein